MDVNSTVKQATARSPERLIKDLVLRIGVFMSGCVKRVLGETRRG